MFFLFYTIQVISQDMDMPPLLPPPPPRQLVSNFPGNETKPEEDVKVIDLANEEATEEEKVKNMWSRKESGRISENIPLETPSQPKVVFVKCKICLKKVRKDMIERHKRVRHAVPRSIEEKPDIQVTNNQPLSSKEPSSENSAEKNPNLEVVRQVKTELSNEIDTKDVKSEIQAGSLNKTDYCTICQRKFKLRKYYLKHMQQIHRGNKTLAPKQIKSEEFDFKCSDCSQTFTSQFYLNKHLLKSHGKRDLTLYCKLCKQDFKFPRYLNRHKKAVHAETGELHLFEKDTSDMEENFKCPDCKETFITEKIARYHQLRKHTKSEKQPEKVEAPKSGHLFCKLCKYGFRLKKYLDRHKKSVHGDELHLFEKEDVGQEENFSCTVCNEIFITENSLKYHQSRKHAEETPSNPENTCDLCNKVFKASQYLRTHKEMSHSDPKSSIAQMDIDSRNCKLCGKQFTEKSSAWNMKRHMMRMHSGTK